MDDCVSVRRAGRVAQPLPAAGGPVADAGRGREHAAIRLRSAARTQRAGRGHRGFLGVAVRQPPGRLRKSTGADSIANTKSRGSSRRPTAVTTSGRSSAEPTWRADAPGTPPSLEIEIAFVPLTPPEKPADAAASSVGLDTPTLTIGDRSVRFPRPADRRPTAGLPRPDHVASLQRRQHRGRLGPAAGALPAAGPRNELESSWTSRHRPPRTSAWSSRP